ncbi:putative entry exclusion protein TrbK-alt [Bradyrhizobium sp.]|uniref:putative entry exclusion protein TrbK-alt n=1 Tax=Bradyrhizobium sp. TaxID=376 RepID=UPI004037B5AA
MSVRSRIDRLSMVAGVAAMVLVVAACAIKLRDDERQISSASSASPDAYPLTAELARCRRVMPEQTDALEACRRVWAEHRRQFLGHSKTPAPTAHPNDNAPNRQSPAPALRNEMSRLPQGWPPISPRESE